MAKNSSKLTVAIADTTNSSWTGGGTYMRNLLECLSQYSSSLNLLVLTNQEQEVYAGYNNAKIVPYSDQPGTVRTLTQKVVARWFGRDYYLSNFLSSVSYDVDLIFPGWLKLGSKTAVLCWIPDFQHIHLPEMYTSPQIVSLNKKYKQGAANATLVVLSSDDARKDFCTFAPSLSHKGRVMRFVAHIPRNLYDTSPDQVTHTYHLPERFFYLPNQFWRHKNHTIVIEALRILRDRNVKPFVVFTGNPIDSRHPTYFAQLMQSLSVYGVRDQVAFLGLVPHEHVYMLIRQSICVLNPSLFEGWSTTVEEAKSVGKRLIISDLTVHREQDPPQAVYFDPHDENELASIMEMHWNSISAGPDRILEQQAREMLPIRMKGFSDRFEEIAFEAIAKARHD